ncbi:unnamed protein product [Clonostachys solani]|uniref:Ricin B lectin domain-containing protein n=1 Tax=Clonostachys solani TaxID=160281 RepID=A0A9N9Z4V5_9HYPO|nr:unnamed protein product [Clonostachys solani]
MVDFTVKDDFDSNAWYQLTEERVDNYGSTSFGSSLTVDTTSGFLSMQAANKNYFQFLPVDNVKGRYAIRNSMTGIRKQLSVCYVEDEIADGKTQPCFVTSNGADEQKWDVSDWGNKTYSFLRFTNKLNGTDYYLDCHKGNPPFMSNQIDTSVYQPAQRWLYRSREAINDGGFSTTFTNLPTSSTSGQSESKTTESGSSAASASATTTNSAATTSSAATSSPDSSNSGSSSSGISSGAAAGIGIGVALGIIGIALAAFFFWWRRRNQTATAGSATELPAHGIPPASDGTSESHYHKPMHSATAWSMAESQKDRQSPYVPHSSPPPQSAIAASEMSGDNTRHELEGGYQNPFGR